MTTAERSSLPPWIKVKLSSNESYKQIKNRMQAGALNSVCEEARCPNIQECWGGGTATFMILGESCTRGCRFCSIATARRPAAPDPREPERLAESLAALRLSYAVVTTVCRDDLPDQGAGHIAACVRAIRKRVPDLKLEFLVQDFRGDRDCIRTVVESRPDVLAHNLETVERLTPSVRDRKAGYRQSLEVLKEFVRLEPNLPTKTSLMLGLGETEKELLAAFRDLRETGVEFLTLGQYLRPTSAPRHLKAVEYVAPERFDALGAQAREMGFKYVASGPLVRSSYRAGELFIEGELKKR